MSATLTETARDRLIDAAFFRGLLGDVTLTRPMSNENLAAKLKRLHAMQSWALKSEFAPRINAMLDLARSEPGIPVLPEDLDRDGWLLNCVNGTLDLRTGQLREHRREDLLTKLSPTPYEPNAACPHWLKFLTEIFPDPDLIDYMQRLLGYCLTGDTREHLLAVFHGNGANGKSVLICAALAVLGEDYAATAMPDLLMARRGEHHPTEIANLYGKRLLVCQETGAGRRLNEPLVKWLTGGDKLKARRMREDFWEFPATYKAILVTNHKPEVRGTDEGTWRRLRLIPFTVTFPNDKQDKTRPAKLATEAPGILAWAVRGCLEWQSRGMMTPECVMAATRNYRVEEDTLASFLAECCVRGEGKRCKAGDLYKRFKEWLGESNPPSQKAFESAMSDKGFERITNNGTWYEGVELRP
jgi:putative DNA primase/helicase